MTRTAPLLLVLALTVLAATPAIAGDTAPSAGVAAVAAARASRPEWRLGRLTLRAHHRPGARAELLVGDEVVARLRVDPATGRFLARGERGGAAGGVDLDALRPAVERSLAALEIGEWAWPVEHGRWWGVPLRQGGHVVGRLAVDVGTGRLRAVRQRHEDDEDD